MLSILETYRNQNVLLAGASGFIGKVWLAMVLEKCPEIGTIYILMRSMRNKSAKQRFEDMINQSFVFMRLHEKWGDRLHDLIARKVRVIEGDVTQVDFGLNLSELDELTSNVDLMVNSTGLVDFNPDVREALNVNVNGALHCASFVSSCKKASLIHISTCFVSGTRQGEIFETIDENQSPSGVAFDSIEVINRLESEIKKIEHQFTHHNNLETKRSLRQSMIELGKSTAAQFGYTNTYTFSKALAEKLIKSQYSNISYSVFRPSIVESSNQFPFPGWNEGFNTCGPLAKLIGTWFRYFPARKGNPFDVIPVDLVCQAMMIVGAHLLTGQQHEVYQCGTSDLNPLTIDQAAKLTSKSHLDYYRRNGTSWIQKNIRSRWHIKVIGERFHPLSSKNLLIYSKMARHFFLWMHQKLKMKIFFKLKMNMEKHILNYEQVEYVLRLFKPFIHDHKQIFKTRHLLSVDIREEWFRFNPKIINWKTYWLDIHMPGLKKWCFKKIERKPETLYQPKITFRYDRVEKIQQQA